MKNWQQFLSAKPLLHRIEVCYQLLQQLQTAPLNQASAMGEQADMVAVLRLSLEADVDRLPGRVYYWLQPFYAGHFPTLVSALRSVGEGKWEKDSPSRDAFAQFFRSLPQEERYALGEKLQRPDLGARSARLKREIDAKKNQIQAHFDQHCAN